MEPSAAVATGSSRRTVDDPWAPAAGRPVRAVPRWARPAAAWGLSLGMLAEVWRFGGRSWAVVAVAALLAGVVELARRAPGGRSPIALVARAAVAVGAVVVLVRVIGATPATLLVLALAVADAAIVSWGPTRSWPKRQVATVRPAVALLVAAEVSWVRSASRPTALVLLAAAAVAVEVAGRAPRVIDAVDRWASSALKRLSVVLSSVLLAPVACCFLYLPGGLYRAATWPWRRRGWRASTSEWQDVTTQVGQQRRDARRPFVTVEPTQRRRSLVSGAVVASVCLVAVVAWSARPGEQQDAGSSSASMGERSADDAESPADGVAAPVFVVGLAARYSDMPAYRGTEWADALQAAQSAPIVDGELSGPLRNIHHGDRVTSAPPDCRCPTATLWISGGSAVFGEGQRDDHTIASELVSVAALDGIRLEVRNVGRDGYTFPMEEEWQLEPLLRTERPPDLLVVYDGFNDAMAQVAADFLRPDSPDPRVLVITPSDTDGINLRSAEFLDSGIGPAAGHAAAQRYLAHVAALDRVVAAAGVQVRYFFQADAFTSAAQMRPYERINGISVDRMSASPLAVALSTMESDLAATVTDLRGALASSDTSYFLGLVHHDERGARVVAERIYESIRPQVVAAARRG